MISSFSKFYYGFTITETNSQWDFSEGGAELTAEISVGEYTATTFCIALENALNAAGGLIYAVSFNRSTRKITITAAGAFQILLATGSHRASSPFSLAGFSQGSNLTGASSYEGAAAAGDYYVPQFKLQDYVAPDNLQEAVEATINESASGDIQVVKFGNRSFYEFNIMFATDIEQPDEVIRTNLNGIADLRRFMRFLITKAPCEIMPDENTPASYDTIVLESTSENSKGVGYRLKEMYDKGLPGYFQTQKLKFRVMEA